MRRAIVLKYFKPLLTLCQIVLLIASLQSVSAQNTTVSGSFAPITAQNVTQITQIERIGNGVPRSMIFSPDGSRLAVATALGVWVIDSHAPNGALSCAPTEGICHLLEGQGGAESVTFSPDGSMIAAGGDDNSILVWNAATSKVVARLENHIYPISAVVWSSDGKLLASGDWSGVVRLWDTSNWSEYRVLTTTEKIIELRFNAQRTELTANFNGDEVIWDIASGADITPAINVGLQMTTYQLGMDTRDGFVDYSADTSRIQITNWRTKALIATFDGFYGELGSVFFTPDGRVGASPINQTYLWSLSTGQPDDTPQPVLSPDGTRKATFGNDGVIRLLNAKTGNQIAALYGHIRAVKAVAFSPDGRLLVSASDDDTIQVWDATVTQDSGSLMVLRGHTSGVTGVAFNADGTLMASSSFDGTVRLWGIKT